jgi:hypothetical protein
MTRDFRRDILRAKKEQDFPNFGQSFGRVNLEFHVDRDPAPGNMRAQILN